MKVKQLNQPYVIETRERDGELVQITIRAVDGGTLGIDEIREATRQVNDYARRTMNPLAGRRVGELTGMKVTVTRNSPETVRQMVRAYRDGEGRVTDEYLARLAVAYEELAPEGRNVSARLAAYLGKSTQTVKGHLMDARKQGFLSPAPAGKEGGVAEPKARELIAADTIPAETSD